MSNAKVITASLDSTVADAIRASISTPEFSHFDDSRYVVFPGFCDVHVHFREPGFSYKETMATGSAASARGGYTAVCTMPNLNPVPDSVEHLNEQLKLIEEGASMCTPMAPSLLAKRGKLWRTWREWPKTSSASPTTARVSSPTK